MIQGSHFSENYYAGVWFLISKKYPNEKQVADFFNNISDSSTPPRISRWNKSFDPFFAAYLGFSCPQVAKSSGLGQAEYRSFRSPRDCQRYFICVDEKPRLYNCGDGMAYNELTNECDGIENVTGCAVPQQYQNENYRGTPTRLPSSYRS